MKGRWIIGWVWVALVAAGAWADAAAVARTPPHKLFGPVFDAVQRARIFPDSKSFADAVPRSAPDAILAAFDREGLRTDAALKRFVLAHFRLPRDNPPVLVKPGLAIGRHIDSLWPVLTRMTAKTGPHSSLLTLPYPYVVPGGRFREVYYWDSYFTMLGLAQSGRRDLIEDMVRNFAWMIDVYGHVPNGSRSYYLSRSQPPFFFKMVALLNQGDPAAAYARLLPQLRKEHDFWMRGEGRIRPGTAAARVVRLRDGMLLNRYWDDSDAPRDESWFEDIALARTSGRVPAKLYRDIRAAAESGWDFSSRWFKAGAGMASIRTTEIVPVDLNALLFGLETAIAKGCARRQDNSCADEFRLRAGRRRAAIDRHLWNASRGGYFDLDWRAERPTDSLSAAMFYPLFFGAADPAQAEAVARTGRVLVKKGGLAATAATTGQQWDAPNGWAPLQWIASEGLRRYRIDLAKVVACRFMVNVAAQYRRGGKLVEKYDVVTPERAGGGGEYPLQDGFGWTNGVMKALMALYPAYAGYQGLDACPKP